MSKDVVLGQIRHLLTFVGGFALARGLVDEAALQEAIGAVLTIVGVIWSAKQKQEQKQQ